MILYVIDSNGYFGGTMEYPDDPDGTLGIPYGTTKRPIPDNIPDGFYALWNGKGWDLVSVPPPVPEVPAEG